MILKTPYRINQVESGTITKYFGKDAINYLENVKHKISYIGEEILDDQNELGIVIGVVEIDGPKEGFYYHIFYPKTNKTDYSKTIKLI